MTEPPALHPQARAHLAATATAPGIATLSVPDARLAVLGYLDLQRPAPAMAQVQYRFIPGPTADLPVRIYRPTQHRGPHPDRAGPRKTDGHSQGTAGRPQARPPASRR